MGMIDNDDGVMNGEDNDDGVINSLGDSNKYNFEKKMKTEYFNFSNLELAWMLFSGSVEWKIKALEWPNYFSFHF